MRPIFTKHIRERFDDRWNLRNKAEDRIEDIFSMALRDKSIFNNHAKMAEIYDEYGHNIRYQFWVYQDIIFVGKEDAIGEEPVVFFVTILVANKVNAYSRCVRNIKRKYSKK